MPRPKRYGVTRKRAIRVNELKSEGVLPSNELRGEEDWAPDTNTLDYHEMGKMKYIRIPWLSDVAGRDQLSSHARLFQFFQNNDYYYLDVFFNRSETNSQIPRSVVINEAVAYFASQGIRYRSAGDIRNYVLGLETKYTKAKKKFFTPNGVGIDSNTFRLAGKTYKTKQAQKMFIDAVESQCPSFWALQKVMGDNLQLPSYPHATDAGQFNEKTEQSHTQVNEGCSDVALNGQEDSHHNIGGHDADEAPIKERKVTTYVGSKRQAQEVEPQLEETPTYFLRIKRTPEVVPQPEEQIINLNVGNNNNLLQIETPQTHQLQPAAGNMDKKRITSQTQEQTPEGRIDIKRLLTQEESPKTQERPIGSFIDLKHALREEFNLQKQELEVQKNEIDLKKNELDMKKNELDIKKNELEMAEQALTVKEKDLVTREQNLSVKEQELTIKEQDLEAKKQELAVRDQALAIREQDLAVLERASEIRKRARESNTQFNEMDDSQRERKARIRQMELNNWKMEFEVLELKKKYKDDMSAIPHENLYR